MGAVRLVDTNVLLYAVSEAPEDHLKQRVALDLLDRRDLALSVQVLQEFYTQGTRASRSGALTHHEATAWIQSLERFPVQTITREVLWEALAIRERFGLSYWDSAILAAARIQGCDTIYSEDLSDSQDYQGLRVINPFLQGQPHP